MLAEQLNTSHYVWDTTHVPDGLTYWIRIVANDSLSTASTELDTPFLIDNVNLPPEVQVISPNGGEVWNGNQLIQWTAEDPDAQTLTYTIQYCTDGGGTWVDLAADLRTTSYSYPWNTTEVSDSIICLVRVVASDGVLTGVDDSNALFTIDNTSLTSSEFYVQEFYSISSIMMGILVILGSMLLLTRRRLIKNDG